MWTIVIVVFVALFYTLLLYYRNKNNKLPAKWLIFLSVLRFLATFILAFLLLSPFIKTRKKELRKPIIIFAQDNSASILMNKDSAWYAHKYHIKLHDLYQKLSQKYSVDTFLFGEKVTTGGTPDFKENTSDYGMLFTKIKQDYTDNDVGALIIAGDGIYNKGFDPVDAARNISFPIYAIVLGDTTLHRDLKINNTRFNSIVYQGDKFPIEISITAKGMKGKKAILNLWAFGKKNNSKQIFINDNNFHKTFKFYVDAIKSGKQHIKIEINSNIQETNKLNNIKHIFINVLNNKQHILIISPAPHPDIGAIRDALESKRNYKVDINTNNNKITNLNHYDLIILHGIPSTANDIKLLKKINKDKIPVLFILDTKINFTLFNSLNAGIQIKSETGKTENAQAIFNNSFTLFNLEKQDVTTLTKLPPLVAPFGNWLVKPGFYILASQKIGNLNTDFPLLVFGEKNNVKRGFVCGEGLWLWKLHDFLQNNNSVAFDELINRMTQFLVARKDKRYFRVIAKNNYNISSNVTLKAELYNQAYQPVNNVTVALKLKNENGNIFNYSFLPGEKAYSLNLGHIPVGIYNFHAKTQLGKNIYRDKGSFIVSALSTESLNTTASPTLFYRLTSQHNGRMIFKNNIDSIPYIVKHSDKLKIKIKYLNRYIGFFNIPLILSIILLLLSLEWFLRKYFGGY